MNKLKYMNLNYQLIKKEIDGLDKSLVKKAKINNDDGKKFSLLVLKKLSNYRGQKLLKFYSDGAGDHQIDSVYFYEGNDELVINVMTCIFNSKPQSTFSNKDVTDFIYGIKYLLFGGDTPDDINEKVKEIKLEIDEQKEIYENKYTVNIKFVSSADVVLNSTSKSQIQKFQNNVNSSGADLSFEEINGQNIAAMFSSRTVLKTPIPIKLSGKSYYSLTGKEGFICRLPIEELVKIYFGFEENKKKYKGYGDYLFTDNIRKDLGIERKINKNIYNTATDENLAENFEYYNNGLTILYDEMTGTVTGDSPVVYLKGLQVVNGCQTINTLKQAKNDGKLANNIYITCRFIKRANDEKFVQSVITYTNSQNAISERDLHSNDPIQYNIQTILKNFDILYERKLNEFRDEEKSKLIVDAVDAAQAFLCCELKKPNKAKQDKRKLFGVLYDEIFDSTKSDLAYKMFVSHLVLDSVLEKQSEHRKKKQTTKKQGKIPKFKMEDLVISHGSYHIAAKLYQRWFNECENLEKIVKSKKLPKSFNTDYKKALSEISNKVSVENIERENLAKYFKANSLF
ncbi:MAG: AIPR family protein [Candidatus Paceibacterota bacterium]|jgi:hypothetical protein